MSSSTRTGGREATKGIIPGRIALSVGKPELREPPGFQWTLLTNLARMESGHTPSRAIREYWDGDVPWIGIRDATGNHGKVITDTLDHVSDSGLEHSSARLLPEGTVCLSRTASVGFVVQMGRPMATSQDFVNWVCGPGLNGNYLRYILMLEQESVRRFAHGTTHQTMYYPEAKALNVLVPERPRQDAIVEVLNSIDDKIAANDRAVRICDRLARALVSRARDGGVIAVSQVASVTMGSSPPGSSYNETGEGTPFFQGVRDFGFRFPATRVWTTEPVRLAESGDTLLSVRAPVGRANLAAERMCIGRGLAGLRSRFGTPMTLFHQIRSANQAWAQFDAEGTVFGAINKVQLEASKLPSIGTDVAAELEVHLRGLESVIASMGRESLLLERHRDELLPLLLSGAVGVEGDV